MSLDNLHPNSEAASLSSHESNGMSLVSLYQSESHATTANASTDSALSRPSGAPDQMALPKISELGNTQLASASDDLWRPGTMIFCGTTVAVFFCVGKS